MLFTPEIRRRSLLPLIGVMLALAYFLVFVPLDRRADALDASLSVSWKKLSGALGQTNATSLDFTGLTNQFQAQRAALKALDKAQQQALERVDLGEEMRTRLVEPFQLVDFEGASSRRKEELLRAAQEQKVVVEPAVLAGFPVRTADMEEPALLWAELTFLDNLLASAIHAKVAAIHSVTVVHPARGNSSAPRRLHELPIQAELTGSAQNIGTFLQSLPRRGSELKAAGLPEISTNKPPLFIDRLVLRKQSPEKPDEVRVSLQVAGFVFRK